jgi:tripeptidyl-peptidase I
MAVAEPDVNNTYNDYYSGGGFSNVFTMPSYQHDAVTNYLTKYKPPYNATRYNNTGKARGFPDVSALGRNLATVYLGQAIGIGEHPT